MKGDGPRPSGEDDRIWPSLLVSAHVLLFLAVILGSALYA